MRRRTIILTVVAALLVALPAGWYFGSPWWTLWRMREAARDGDVKRLAAYVDFKAVAEAQGRGDWRSSLAALRSDAPELRKLGALAERILARPRSDGPERPDSIRAWLSNMSLPLAGGSGDRTYRPAIEHRGLDEFAVRDARDEGESGILIFRRHGLGWKLEAVRFGEQ